MKKLLILILVTSSVVFAGCGKAISVTKDNTNPEGIGTIITENVEKEVEKVDFLSIIGYTKDQVIEKFGNPNKETVYPIVNEKTQPYYMIYNDHTFVFHLDVNTNEISAVKMIILTTPKSNINIYNLYVGINGQVAEQALLTLGFKKDEAVSKELYPAYIGNTEDTKGKFVTLGLDPDKTGAVVDITGWKK